MIVPKLPELDRQATPVDGMTPSGNSVASHPQDAPPGSPPFGAGQNPMPPVQSPDAPVSMAGSLTAAPTAAPSAQTQPQSMSHLLFSTPSAQTSATKALFDRITAEMRKIYVGQDELVLGTLVALFSSGHVLIESVPGLGKTLFVRALGRVLGCQFGRIQFTADLMPSDITGAPIFDMKTAGVSLSSRPGLHAVPAGRRNQPLAGQDARGAAGDHAGVPRDGRAAPATSSKRPFLVLATQNPIEIGRDLQPARGPARPLHVQDRGRLSDAPRRKSRSSSMHSQQVDLDERLAEDLQTVTSPAGDRRDARELCGQVHVDDKLFDYINTLVRRTREWPQFHLGASPRAGIALVQGARTLAAFRGRDYAVPDDVVADRPAGPAASRDPHGRGRSRRPAASTTCCGELIRIGRGAAAVNRLRR